MTHTSNLNLMLLAYNQSQKEIVANEALVAIDALLNNSIVALNFNEPPVNLNNGDAYIIGGNPGGEWANKAGYLAYYFNGWRYLKPKDGLTLWVKSVRGYYILSDGIWRNYHYQSYHLSGQAVYELHIMSLNSQYQLDIDRNCEVKINQSNLQVNQLRIIISQKKNHVITWPTNVKNIRPEIYHQTGYHVLNLCKLKDENIWLVY